MTVSPWSVVRGPLIAGLMSLAIGPTSVVTSRSTVGFESQEETPQADATMVLVVGAGGAEVYSRTFGEWADRWSSAAASGGVTVTIIGRDADKSAGETADRDRLQAVLADEQDGSGRPLWIVLIGHGTFDGRTANFNLRGKDVSARELAEWLAECKRPLAIVNCASASAPFIDRLAGPDRVVVTATNSGSEANFARFGDDLSRVVGEASADLDKDGQTSLLEAFLMASRQTQEYYDGQRQLATEHALLDDNGDAQGVRADAFAGLEPTAQAKEGATLDGRRAHQWHLVPSEEERRLPVEVRQRRNELELQLAQLREQKDELAEDDYYRQIEPLLLEIARLYASVDQANEGPNPASEGPNPASGGPKPASGGRQSPDEVAE